MANLWIKFLASDRYPMATKVTKCKKTNKILVAATFEKAKTYIFDKGDSELCRGRSRSLVPALNHMTPPKAIKTEKKAATCLRVSRRVRWVAMIPARTLGTKQKISATTKDITFASLITLRLFLFLATLLYSLSEDGFNLEV